MNPGNLAVRDAPADWSKAQNFATPAAVASNAGLVTFDFTDSGQVIPFTLTENVSAITLTGRSAALSVYAIWITQADPTPFTMIGWPAGVIWMTADGQPPSVTTKPGGTAKIGLTYDGANWCGVILQEVS